MASPGVPPSGSTSFDSLRVLLVEDNPVSQRVAQGMLRHFRVVPDVADNGIEAVDACQTQCYDLIFMDIQMPKMDGIEATRQIRSSVPRDAQPRIVALTANALVGDRDRLHAIGLDEYLSKPVNLHQLRQELEAALAQQAQRVLQTRLPEPSAAAPAAAPAVPETRFRSMYERVVAYLGDDDQELVNDILQSFLDHGRELVAQLQNGLDQGKPNTIADAAHSMKSSSKMVGGDDLHTVCMHVEKEARAANLAVLPDLVGQAIDRFRELETVLVAGLGA